VVDGGGEELKKRPEGRVSDTIVWVRGGSR
jgi:hypothetical protein